MPTYEYECKKCGHSFETFQSMSDEPLKECPQCGKEVRRLINGGSGVIFKGSGFYVTDKGKGTKTASAKQDGKTADGKNNEGKSTEGKGEGKSPACASCPASSGGSCPASGAAVSSGSEKAAG